MPQPKTNPLTRRDFLKIAAGAAISTVVFPLLVGCEPKPTATSEVPAPVTEPPTGAFPTAIIDDNFPQPKTIYSVKGILQTTLLIKMMPPPAKFNPPTPTPTPTPDPTKPILFRMYGTPKKGVDANPLIDDEWHWSFPGPTFRVNPGDRIELKLLNYLPQLPKDQIGVCEPAYYPTTGPTPAATPAAGTPTLIPTLPFNNDAFPDCFSENNVTNLHYHGMHVKQGESGDDVLLAIYPYGQNPHEAKHGEEHGMHVLIGENNYHFDVPKDHPQGTFWYHPHKHGATDLQVANGMAGAIIVNDTAPLLKDRQPVDQVLVIQDILQDLVFPLGGSGKLKVQTLNGVREPIINMQAGEIQRWRFVNATGNAASAFQLNFDGADAPEMFLIAVDGNYLTESHWKSTTPTNALFLAPGNRADVLVVASKEGTFGVQVKSTTDNQKNKKNESTPTPIPAGANGFTNLLTVNVSGVMSPAMKLPETLPKLPNNLRPFGPGEKDVCSRTLTFGVLPDDSPTQTPVAPGTPTATPTPLVGGGGAPGGTAPKWAINGKQFDPKRVDECMLLNTSETWTLINTTAVAHPFHIHVNPFLIQEYVDPTPADPDNPRTTGDNPVGQWQDTIIIPAAKINKKGELKTGKVVIRQRFMDFTGKFVLHCHILGHEDRGMMQLLQVVKDASECTSGGACVAP